LISDTYLNTHSEGGRITFKPQKNEKRNWHDVGIYMIMQVVHINTSNQVKTIKNSIVDLFTKEVITLKAIHKQLLGTKQAHTPQFTGFIA
jgi:hypothetical protein